MSEFRSDSARLLAAAHFAADKHRDQRRKDTSASPYINHPLAVAEVNDAFGGEVLGVVLEVTDDKQLEKGERKRLQVEKAPGMSDRAKLVKLGDKICNVTDVASSPPAGWSGARRVEYLDWTEAVVRGCRGVHAGLEAHYDRALADARAIVGGVAASASVVPGAPGSDAAGWKIIHQDLFDRDTQPSGAVEGDGLANGLIELWARYLIEQIGASGIGGLARFSLSWTGGTVQMPPASKAGSRVREWVFGPTPDARDGYVAGGDAELLALIGQAHARLIVGGRGGEVILDTADASDTQAAFSEALALLTSGGS